MPYAIRQFACPDCGQIVHKRAPEAATVRCLEHAIARSIDCMRQMREHRGPIWTKYLIMRGDAAEQMASKSGIVYRRYLAGLINFAYRELQRLGDTELPMPDAARWRPGQEHE